MSVKLSEEEKSSRALKRKREKYMRAAIKEAGKALDMGEVPIGCVIVRGDKIIARGYNRRKKDGNTLSHAEIIAINKACRKSGDWRLEDCELYVTLEPCPMCAGAIVQARIPVVFIGCMNPKAGFAGSIIDLFHMDKLNHQVETYTGICGEECSRMLSGFFKALRIAHPRKERHHYDYAAASVREKPGNDA